MQDGHDSTHELILKTVASVIAATASEAGVAVGGISKL
jgi:hypothetical protein